MTKPILTLLVMTCAAMAAACGGDEVLEPEEKVTTAISGVYDLTATIETFDPAWGYDLTGWGYAAVLTFQRDPRYMTGTAGTFSARLTGPEGEEEAEFDGVIVSRRDWQGRVVIELGTNFTLVPGEYLQPSILQGRFGVGGHIDGPFIARPRADD
jgi:hypothetical protein